MTVKIRPMTDLAKKAGEIENLCIEQDLPVFITKNGADHLVIMSHHHYEKLQAELVLYKKLIVAERESKRGEMLDFNEVMDDIDSALKEHVNGAQRISG